MRIVCLIMVGAFLLSIAIADNDNSMRLRPQNIRRQLSFLPNINRRRLYSQAVNVPRLTRRLARNDPIISPRNDVMLEDNIASPAIAAPVVQFIHPEAARVPKALQEKTMILEPVQKPRKSSWMDWMPDFFDDDAQEAPGSLIGPINFPGLGNKVFIRHPELDDETNHVVIHLINREPPPDTYSSQYRPPQPPQQQNNHPYYTEGPLQHPNSNAPPGKLSLNDYDFEREEFASKILNGNPWQLQINSPENEIKDKNSHILMPNEGSQSKYSVMLLKQSRAEPSRVFWSRYHDREGNHYGRSLNPVDSKGPSTFPTPTQTQVHGSSSNRTMPKLEESKVPLSGPQYISLSRYGYPHSTEAASESFRSAVSLTPQRNHAQNEILDEITVMSRAEQPPRRQVNRLEAAAYRVSLAGNSYNDFSDSPSRSSRNRYSTTKHFENSPDFHRHRQRSPATELENTALHVIPAPNLQKIKSRGEEVVQSIMSMTASQTWNNVTSWMPKMIEEKKSTDVEQKRPTTPKSAELERRMDASSESRKTKETPRSRAIESNKSSKPEASMKEAVRKLMSSFTQWRDKVVTTAFVKELDERPKRKSKSEDRDKA